MDEIDLDLEDGGINGLEVVWVGYDLVRIEQPTYLDFWRLDYGDVIRVEKSGDRYRFAELVEPSTFQMMFYLVPVQLDWTGDLMSGYARTLVEGGCYFEQGCGGMLFFYLPPNRQDLAAVVEQAVEAGCKHFQPGSR